MFFLRSVKTKNGRPGCSAAETPMMERVRLSCACSVRKEEKGMREGLEFA